MPLGVRFIITFGLEKAESSCGAVRLSSSPESGCATRGSGESDRRVGAQERQVGSSRIISGSVAKETRAGYKHTCYSDRYVPRRSVIPA